MNSELQLIDSITPDNKKEVVGRMFTSAARRYDLLNTVLSMGLHHYWKRYAVNLLPVKEGESAIDLCAGTADISVLLAGKVRSSGRVVALDLNEEMLLLGDKKVRDMKLDSIISCTLANAEEIPYPDNSFDYATVAFGIRNVTDIPKCLREMHRVIKPGGHVLCLEFSKPTTAVMRALYDIYSFYLMPSIGTWLSGDTTNVYRYLPESIRRFPAQEEFKAMMEEAGLKDAHYTNLTGGIVAVHQGEK
ncbi:MAG: bifunctional demethylmenaquinone methyltransferase/2-methoxy-6-polyprenyl-1,4-benzoquinol methylase UbiE [Nitrospirota bacterium]|nr:bifunctional demethylmenaquinone methyltransferase/2-methoxy-6-polyprenyl-1,4-benzoquinol methylase UbiE [Nitrospirota bacterium]